MFKNHKEQIFDLLAFTDDDEADKIIDELVQENRRHTGMCLELEEDAALSSLNNMDMIGAINLSVGSRRSGRPPDCWRQFDAILNVTDNEYPIMSESIMRNDSQFYLNLPVAEGKRDKTELERFMPLGLVFVIHHLQQGRRVLVHCNQGKDRSVAMVLALVVLACPLEYPLQLRQGFEKWEIGSLHSVVSNSNDEDDECDERHMHSGLSKGIIDVLVSGTGKESFLAWVHEQIKVSTHKPLVDKERLQIALHLIKQDRENADPSRSTMQKLNRFFMTSAMYREIPLKESSC
jgi:Rit1 DUSP-like domain